MKNDQNSLKGLRLKERQVMLRITGTFLGGALVLNSFVGDAFFYEAEVSAISAIIGAIILSIPIVIGAVSDLIKGERRMRELVALALAACFALQDYQTAGILAFFMLLAELVERRTAIGAQEALEKLVTLSPRKARVLDESGGEREIEASAVSPGSTIVIRPGENVPADGVILEGASALNEANITGESIPADKAKDEEVFAGTTNLTSVLKVRVSRAGEDTVLGKVRTLIMKAQGTKLPIMRLIDRYAGWYTPLVVMIAGTMFFFTRDPSRGITALVVSCPTAIILAMPTAMVAALAAAARLGVLIKNVGDLEIAGDVGAIAFDKTGTLTTGVLAVKRLLPAEGVSPEELLTISAALEKHSNHPVARAIMKVADEAGLDVTDAEGIEEVAGRGMKGRMGGSEVLIGRERWLKEQGVDFSAVDSAGLEGLSVLFTARDGRAVGVIGLEDRTRKEARNAVDGLKKMGIKQILMFTGDKKAVARRTAEELGCTDFEAECLPERKLELVEDLKKRGYRVSVVGDGVNDAPALAASDLGIAMGAAGSDVAVDSASIALMSSDLGRLPFLVALSKRTMRVVYQNLGFGILVILAGLTFAGLGILTPRIAAFYYIIASLVVVFNSARLVAYSGGREG